MEILDCLTQQGEDHWLPWQQKRPLLHIACERGAWNCVKFLVIERQVSCIDNAVLDNKFFVFFFGFDIHFFLSLILIINSYSLYIYLILVSIGL